MLSFLLLSLFDVLLSVTSLKARKAPWLEMVDLSLVKRDNWCFGKFSKRIVNRRKLSFKSNFQSYHCKIMQWQMRDLF